MGLTLSWKQSKPVEIIIKRTVTMHYYYITTVLSLQQPAVSRGQICRSDFPNHSFTPRALSHFSSNIYNPETEAPRPFHTCLDSVLTEGLHYQVLMQHSNIPLLCHIKHDISILNEVTGPNVP